MQLKDILLLLGSSLYIINCESSTYLVFFIQRKQGNQVSLNYEPDLILWFSYKINVEKRGVRMCD